MRICELKKLLEGNKTNGNNKENNGPTGENERKTTEDEANSKNDEKSKITTDVNIGKKHIDWGCDASIRKTLFEAV